MKALGYIVAFTGLLTLGVGISAGVAWCVMKLWNFAAVQAFGAPRLGFLQTWALAFILSLIGGCFRKARK